VFSAHDPEDEQLIRALDRFVPGTIKLLTRDQPLLDAHPDKTISPERVIQRLEKTLHNSIDFIDLAAQQQFIRPKLEKKIHKVLAHGRYIMGPEVAELEERLADYTDVKHCIGVASGSDALQVALMALEIGHGDEVITTPFSFIATAEIIAVLGAVPVFVDVDPKTYNMDPNLMSPFIEEWNSSVYAQYTIQVDNRGAVQEKLKAKGIPTAVHYSVPLHKQPVFVDQKITMPCQKGWRIGCLVCPYILCWMGILSSLLLMFCLKGREFPITLRRLRKPNPPQPNQTISI